MRRTRFHALAGMLLAILLFAPAAEARRGPCIPGIKRPTCYVWTGKVMQVADGDTVNVRIRQNGQWSERRDVRLTGVQAMELTSYSRVGRGRRGACHARAAAERLERLLKGPRKQATQDSACGAAARRRDPGPARPPAALDRLPPGRPLARRGCGPHPRGPRPLGPEPQGVGVEQALLEARAAFVITCRPADLEHGAPAARGPRQAAPAHRTGSGGMPKGSDGAPSERRVDPDQERRPRQPGRSAWMVGP